MPKNSKNGVTTYTGDPCYFHLNFKTIQRAAQGADTVNSNDTNNIDIIFFILNPLLL